MNRKFQKNKPTRSPDIHKLISKIRDINKKNLLRGYSAKNSLSSSDIDEIRKGTTTYDSLIVGALLKGPRGLQQENKKLIKRTSADLFKLTSFPPISWRNEVSYTAGYLNSKSAAVTEVLSCMKALIWLEDLDAESALTQALEMAKIHGASNYLSYKLAYIRSAKELSATSLGLIVKIEDEIGHRKSANMHYSALENLSSKVSLFSVAQRRISGLVGKVNGNFRKAMSLSNFIPTPLDEEDVAGFLLRATESSLVDAVYSILVIFNLKERLGSVHKELETHLSDVITSQIQEFLRFALEPGTSEIITAQYCSNNSSSDESMNLYRISAAFLERERFAKYRNKVDRVIGTRLLSEIIGSKTYPDFPRIDDKSILIENKTAIIDGARACIPDTFYRTYLLLKFIEDKTNIFLLSENEIKFIFENTLRLDVLLTEDEINTLYLIASNKTKSLVAVLALALYRTKSIDPDIDFDFRSDFIDHVNLEYNGSILDFINYLLTDSPDVANYIVASLDEVTLQKMYTLVKNASEAAQIRGDILRAVGEKLNRIEFIMEADAIITRSKLSKLQIYFDSSRMYVDSVAMKKWLDSNPTISTEQYRSLYPKIQALIASVDTGENNSPNLVLLQITDQNEDLLAQIAKEAFEQFCLNTEFGIQSYLGRRIRHNTLDGVTTDTVDAVLRNPDYRIVTSNSSMKKTADDWMQNYKSIIDKLRREQLQFKTTGSLFNANIDLDDKVTKENIRKLSNTLRNAGGGELLNEMVIAFCWRQITPQLENAARYIRTTLLKEANSSIDKYFSGFFGVIESQIKADLHEAVNAVLKKVADWFQVPQTGFISACARELCQIILIELNRNNHVKFSGNLLDKKYTGISVHRLYDCLGVLLKNAHKHGVEDSELVIDVNSSNSDSSSSLDLIVVRVTSKAANEEYLLSKERILNSIESLEGGIDMVTEGYTGIKKIKIITRASEGKHSVIYNFDDPNKLIMLGFSMHVEFSSDLIAEKDEP